MTRPSIVRRQRSYAYSVLIKSPLSRLFSVVCQYALERDMTACWADQSAREPSLNPPGPLFPSRLPLLPDCSSIFPSMIFSMINMYVHILHLLWRETKLMSNIAILRGKKKPTTTTTANDIKPLNVISISSPKVRPS